MRLLRYSSPFAVEDDERGEAVGVGSVKDPVDLDS